MKNKFLLYQTAGGKVAVDVLIKDETVWLTKRQMAELFGVDRSGISRHIKNILQAGELEEAAVCANFAHTIPHGVFEEKTQTKEMEFYNLDMIISVGYRVNSARGAQFRMWATQKLKEFIVKGFVINSEKLKDPDNIFGKDYFDELLEKIREIRASEKRFYKKVTDIYALSVDYDPKAKETLDFFRAVQNKLLFAATKKTAAEIVSARSNPKKNNMGLMTWKGDKVRRADVTVSKNYLRKGEIEILNRITVMYLDYAELQARERRQMFMKDWREKLDAFLRFNDREVLQNAGKISKQIADKEAIEKYEKFALGRKKTERQQEDDFDREIKRLPKK